MICLYYSELYSVYQTRSYTLYDIAHAQHYTSRVFKRAHEFTFEDHVAFAIVPIPDLLE
jgi:hypothetical protein